MTEWYEDFFRGLYGRVLSNQFDDGTTLRQARAIKKLLGVRRGQSVLDIPCGMGRLTIPLARMGLRMTGVDLTAGYILKARRDARKARVRAEFIRSDMRDVGFDGEFDAAFNWFSSFAYFPDADNLAFCRRILRALRPGGKFLVDVMNKSWILSHFRSRNRSTIGGVEVSDRSRWDAKTNRLFATWIFRRGGTTERHHINMRIFNGADIRELLRSAGFGEVRLNGAPLGRPFTRHSPRLIAVGIKPG
jgi:SAM-dependent methyltransferase